MKNNIRIKMITALQIMRTRVPLFEKGIGLFIRVWMACFMMRKIEVYRKAVEGKSGLEIGGPSQIFQEKNLLPFPMPSIRE